MLAMDEQAQTMNIEERRIVAEPTETLEDISLDEDDLGKSTRIGADLEGKIKKDLIRFLREILTCLLGVMRICRVLTQVSLPTI